MMRRYGMVLMLAMIAGCNTLRTADEAEGVTLRVEPTTVAAGGTIELILENASDGQIGYNLCTSALQRIVNDAAQPVPSDRVCTMELRTLEPSQNARYTLQLPTDLAAGEYRMLARIERMSTGESVSVTSDTFRVRS